MNATYSPEDNKLRLYASTRLDADTYARVKAHGFIWAPKQQLFVAPRWTPDREDLLIELCGEIGDEDTSLVERAEERADRFEDYHDKRAQEADQAHAAVDQVAKRFEGGQPILVGHHSEKRARKDAERITNGMRKAINLWETSKYWQERAKGALHHAKYKERPDVRARRIKGLETDRRREEKDIKRATGLLTLWRNVLDDTKMHKKDGTPTTARERALFVAGFGHGSYKFTLAEYPRELPVSQYEGDMSIWSALEGGIITPEQAQALAIPSYEHTITYSQRLLDHINHRLEYEKAMLDEQGASDLLKPKPRPVQLPLCNYRAPDGIDIENIYHRGEFSRYPQIKMTKAEYAAIYENNRGTAVVEHSHRVRIYCRMTTNDYQRKCVFLTDAPVHEKPAPAEPKHQDRPTVLGELMTTVYQREEPTKFDQLKEQLKEGVKVVVAPLLFVTPPDIAAQMIELADIQDHDCILEPSAGAGNLLRAIPQLAERVALGMVKAVEINRQLADMLRTTFQFGSGSGVVCADFLTCEGLGMYDKIIMNPPFDHGSDIKHIERALSLLVAGGRLVALCANGNRQREAFLARAVEWIDLPPNTFKEAGTGVNVALIVIDAIPAIVDASCPSCGEPAKALKDTQGTEPLDCFRCTIDPHNHHPNPVPCGYEVAPGVCSQPGKSGKQPFECGTCETGTAQNVRAKVRAQVGEQLTLF